MRHAFGALPDDLLVGTVTRLHDSKGNEYLVEAARRVVATLPSCTLLRAEGGWSVVVRVPAVTGEEALVLGLLEEEGVLVHPGYFFDFPREAYLVVSLLPEQGDFETGLARVVSRAGIA